jgi:2-methylcitrate dehydratase PrpD
VTLALTLGTFVADLAARGVPDEACRVARVGFIDCIGTMVAGRNEEAPRILRDVLAPFPGSSTLTLSDERARAPEAAWINGTAAHALDFDDVALRGHPSAVLVPAILAEAEELDASGERMLTAYVAGYEVWGELVQRERGFHHGKGWHPTGIFGAIGAAAACASLRGLDGERAAHAIALAASRSAGVMANFGSMAKPFHAGQAAHSGVLAARLAHAGFTASLDALEHPQGFLTAVSPSGEVDRSSFSASLGRDWRIVTEGLSIKRYPTCYCTHRAIDAMLDLLGTRPVGAEEIASITVSIGAKHATILRNHRPDTGLAAKFSIEFAMSAAVIAGAVGLRELADAFVQRAEVQALIPLVKVRVTEAEDASMPGAAPFDEVSIQLASGETLVSERVSRARGHAQRPLTEEELFAKLRACLEAGNAGLSPELLFARLQAIRQTTARQITALH